MEKFWKWVERTGKILTIIVIIGSILKGWWTMEGIKLFWDTLSPGRLMLYITIFLILFVLISRFFRFIKFATPRSWKIKLGVYWDKNNTPFCPKCKIPLSGTRASNLLHCSNCDQDFNLRYGSKLYPWDEAVEAIKNGEI